MTDSIQVLLAEKVAAQGAESIARKMGYSRKMLASACDRIRAMASDARLGISSAGYDFRYSNRELLIRLAQVLGIESELMEREIRLIERQLAEERDAFRAWIFVETGFKRTSEPIFALAAMESKRRIALPLEVCMMSRPELIKRSSEIVREHYLVANGQLTLWGAIQHYKLILSEAEQALLDTEGNVLAIDHYASTTPAV